MTPDRRGWNWAQGNLFGIPVSGNPVFGIEGSALTTAVLALAAFAAYRWWCAGPGASAPAIEPAGA